MSKRFVLTEHEVKEIRGLYGLITEATEPLVIQGGEFFDNGKWKNFSTKTKATLDAELQKAAKYIQDNKGSVVYVKIVAGESQVTNYDREVNPPTEVQSGYLSTKRAETMKTYITNYFQGLVTQKILDKLPVFEAFETIIGSTPYKKGVDNPDDQKYRNEKFVRVEMAIKPASECIVGLKIGIFYKKEKDPNFPCRGNHRCDKAKFNVLVNNVSIGIVSLNNLSDGEDRGRYLEVTNELARKIMGETPKNLVIQLQCESDECHSDRPEVYINKGRTILYSGCAPAKSERGDTSLMTLLTLDPCGNLIPSLNQSDPNVKVVDETSGTTTTPQNKFNPSEAVELPVGVGYTPEQTAKVFTDRGDMYLAVTDKGGVKYYKATRNFKLAQTNYPKDKFYYFKK